MDTKAVVIIENILKHELSLPDDYGEDSQGNVIPSIVTRDQNVILGRTDQLQITVGFVDAPKVISIVNRHEESEAGVLSEIQEALVSEHYQIDLQSRNNDARDRNWEVITALKSIYSIQKQEENQFKIFRIPSSFVNSGAAEGGSQLNRFSIVITCHVWYNKSKTISDYYDSFPARVDNEETVGEDEGMIEFTEPVEE